MSQATAGKADAQALDSVVASLMQTLIVLKSATLGTSVDGPCLGVLHTIAATGAVRPGDLAAVVRLDASTVSRHLQVLERQGMIVRERDPADGRAFRVAATDKGAGTLSEAATARRILLAEAVRGWGDADIRQLADLLARLGSDLSSVRTTHLLGENA